ncbi:hypothetical protein XELAEV_18042968mg [Xenopus laevis]|uniref:Uncharacterized protein n=1 Tax=Xenopus laevis TaxID=8355 RepID=A0A974C574_XENLA|nr:hypothetical protein XELAEV_18042968mg [Xenopus laevis]
MSTPVCYPRAEEEQEESLEKNIAIITIGGSEGSLESGTTENGTTLYEESFKCSKDSSIDLTVSFTSEEQSSSQLEGSSIYSPEAAFYYLTHESSSIFYSYSCNAITISSESEEEAALDKGPTDRNNGAGTRLSW